MILIIDNYDSFVFTVARYFAEVGQSLDIIRFLNGSIPMLGICLGHQCIGESFGDVVTRARKPMHGWESDIFHDGSEPFEGLNNPFRPARYHSLIVDRQSLEASPLRITAHSEQGEVMAKAHNSHPSYGVQFHPESGLTETGYDLLRNFIHLAMIERNGKAQLSKTGEKMHG